LLGKWEEIVATCAAFATAQGRTIHVGINPNGEVVGIDIGEGTLEDISNKIASNTSLPGKSRLISGSASLT